MDNFRRYAPSNNIVTVKLFANYVLVSIVILKDSFYRFYYCFQAEFY
jgi:hypothetical protein